ncbi:MAG: ammonium transporter [Caldilineales bacterium]|nr:ammonium transporter [Caldilineales bacterium]
MTNDLFWPVLAASLAWLAPAGFTLMAAAAAPPERAWQTALAGLAAVGLAALAFFLVGFSLAFGGVGLVYPDVPGFGGLVWEWSALGPEWGPTWGMAGLAGWALTGPAATPEAYLLFVAHLPWAATATAIPLWALRGRAPAAVVLLSGLLVGGLAYPLAVNWLWGGGWLANLGINLNLGHGLVDFAGAGPVHLVGGAVALAGLLALAPRRAPRPADEPAPLPPAHLPLLAAAGAFFVLAGSVGWHFANPLLRLESLLPTRGMANALLAATGGVLLPAAYTWFVAGRVDPLMAARGLAAGSVAGLALGPFVPPWAALLTGAAAGLLLPLVHYLVTETLRVADDTAVVAVHLLGAAVGLLAVGLWADGLAGAGWNQTGSAGYLGAVGQGVTGLWPAAGFTSDWPGQMQAQAVGLAALFLGPFLAGTVALGGAALAVQGAQGLARRALPGEPEMAVGPGDLGAAVALPVSTESSSDG